MPSPLQRILPAFAALLAFSASVAPVAAATPSPSSSDRPPSIMKYAGDLLSRPASAAAKPAASSAATATPAASAQPAAARPNREVFGFAQAGGLGASTGVGYNTWDFTLLTTVAYFGVHVNAGDGSLIQSDTGWSVWNSADVTNMIGAAHNAGTRVVLTVVYQDTSSGMCTALQHGSTTAQQVAAQVAAKHVDGVNIDYEGSAGACAQVKSLLTQFVATMRADIGSAAHLTVDTYGASAAPGGDGFFDLPGMAPYVNAFFVMAYELDNSNWSQSPLNCSRYCLSPTSAATAYHWNDLLIAQQYVNTVGGAKTILGLPYYGWAACTESWNPNAYPVSGGGHWTVPTIAGLQGIATAPNISNYTEHTDVWDGVDRWATYHGSGTDSNGQSYNCNREFYVDSPASLGNKYDIVNGDGLAGAGIWSLDYGGGVPELWSQLAAHFTQRPTAPAFVTACPGANSVFVGWGASTSTAGPISSYTVTATANGSSSQVTVPGTTTATLFGNLTAGTGYTFAVQATNAQGPGPVSNITSPVAPVSTVSSSYFSWYDHASPGMNGDNVHIVDTSATTPSQGCVYITGVAVQPFNVGAGSASYVGFPQGVIGGPVVLSVYSGPAVLAAQRVEYNQSFNEVAASAAGSNTLYLPWYDHASPGMWNDNIHIINPDRVNTANVSIAGPGPTINLQVPPAAEAYRSWPVGTIGGPVVIQSSVPVIASQRVQYYGTFNEVVARPASDASTNLVSNWYDRASPGMWNDNVHLVDPDPTNDAQVTISIANGPSTSVRVPHGGASYTGFPSGTIGGPVTITSTNGVAVLASQRVQYYGSFNEAPATQSIGRTTQWLPWYDDASAGMVADHIHLVNPGASTVHATLTAPMGVIGIDVPAHGEVYTGWSGGIGGPVMVSAPGPGVIASERVQYYQSFNEALGLT